MANHRTKTSFGQCLCRWCGKRRDGRDCGVDDDMREALRDFAQSHGRTWKSQLSRLWMDAAAGEQLQRVRNVIGPRQLARLETKLVLAYQRPGEKQKV